MAHIRSTSRPGRGDYKKEKLVGFRMLPEKYERLKREAGQRGKTVAELINQILDEKFGWTPSLFEPKPEPKKKAARKNRRMKRSQ